MSQQKQKNRKKQKQKHKERRKDVTRKMPFIIAYQGDPARRFRCAMVGYRDHYDLTPMWIGCKGEGLSRLKRFSKNKVAEIGKNGLIYIEKAPLK